MSKRRGDVVTLDEFLDEVGVDAARWYLVNRGHDQTIEIDVDLARERSEKNSRDFSGPPTAPAAIASSPAMAPAAR